MPNDNGTKLLHIKQISKVGFRSVHWVHCTTDLGAIIASLSTEGIVRLKAECPV